ncbi:hypothetical protein CUJ83_09740 [Methanocella sp. CWC-04]|uniref:Uncharacterized protein n=1 Tax=Methanooceanicella nereidis TaxID=2052831 RepID=A0AAP2REX3_9EURY|nr:hypothetical protein [Methanocella sp. CWC-04]MCD1295280.1 hypothetical protein [Methanocella sp. CWC-04]
MLEARYGDIAISTYKTRQKGRIEEYYLCEPIGSKDDDGTPLNLNGHRITGIKAIYRRDINKTPVTADDKISIRYDPDKDLNSEELIGSILQKYGPGKLLKPELCEGLCRLRSLNNV